MIDLVEEMNGDRAESGRPLEDQEKQGSHRGQAEGDGYSRQKHHRGDDQDPEADLKFRSSGRGPAAGSVRFAASNAQ